MVVLVRLLMGRAAGGALCVVCGVVVCGWLVTPSSVSTSTPTSTTSTSTSVLLVQATSNALRRAHYHYSCSTIISYCLLLAGWLLLPLLGGGCTSALPCPSTSAYHALHYHHYCLVLLLPGACYLRTTITVLLHTSTTHTPGCAPPWCTTSYQQHYCLLRTSTTSCSKKIKVLRLPTSYYDY